MTYYSDELIEEVRSRNDVVDVNFLVMCAFRNGGSTYFWALSFPQ